MRKWRFVSNQNSTLIGINDAGIETFTSNITRSLVREIIQNSLDAAVSENGEPVIVEFNLFDMLVSNMPDAENFLDILEACKNSNNNEEDAVTFFRNAINVMSQITLPVLRVSDYNTKGLEGSQNCEKGSNWSRLVKESGSSNKNQNSGGSFGIGKSAAYACSDLRTVFYSSRDINAINSNIGVARLVSFQENYKDDWTTGIGYFSEDDTFTAIHELAKFDPDFIRHSPGTDIYIMGMHKITDFKRIFIEAVLLDFLVSIIKEKLIVVVQGDIIDKKSLPKVVANLNPTREELKDVIEYYDLLTSPNPSIKKIILNSEVYGKKYGFDDGECTLYLKEADGLNRKILITRNAGMRIFEQDRISGSIEFTGVLIIDGVSMNQAFKKMEVPSHDAWEPGRCRGEEKKYREILSGLKKYLKEIVISTFGNVTTDIMDAIGASDFLPDKLSIIDEEKLKKDDLSVRIKTITGKTVEPQKIITKINDEIEDEYETIRESGSGPGSLEGPIPGSNPRPGSGDGNQEGDNNGNNKTPGSGKKGKNRGYREVSVKKRLISKDATVGSYILSMYVPSTSECGKLVFEISGESGDESLPIKEAKVLNEDTAVQIVHCEGDVVYLNNLKKGEKLQLEVLVDFDQYCMMEVDYYEAKK